MDSEPRTSVTIVSNLCGGKYTASRTTCESVNTTEIAIAPKRTIRFLRPNSSNSGKPAAARIEPAIEVRTSQRQGNCVSCNGCSSFQTGRLRGTDMKRARAVNTKTGLSEVLRLK